MHRRGSSWRTSCSGALRRGTDVDVEEPGQVPRSLRSARVDDVAVGVAKALRPVGDVRVAVALGTPGAVPAAVPWEPVAVRLRSELDQQRDPGASRKVT